MRIFYSFLFLCSCLPSICQKVVDAITLEALAYAEIFTDEGIIIGITDIDGKIDRSTLEKLKSENSNFTIVYLGYEDLSIGNNKSDIDSTQTYLMTRNNLSLPSVLVRSQGLKEFKYAYLDGAYRSWQYNDDVLFYFQEGDVSYRLKLDSDSDKYKRKKKVKKDFEHDSLQNSKELIIPWVIGPPPIETKILGIQELESQGYVINEEIPDSLYTIYFKQRKMGWLEIDKSKNQSKLLIDMIDPEELWSKSRFGYKNELIHEVFIASFSASSLNDCRLSSLTYLKNIVHYNFTTRDSTNPHSVVSIREMQTELLNYSNERKAYFDVVESDRLQKHKLPVLPKALRQQIKEFKELDDLFLC